MTSLMLSIDRYHLRYYSSRDKTGHLNAGLTSPYTTGQRLGNDTPVRESMSSPMACTF